MRQDNLLAKIYHTTVGDNLKLWILDRPVSLLYVSQYYRKNKLDTRFFILP